MRVTVKAVGIGKVEFELKEGQTVGGLLEQLFKRYPDASNRFKDPETREVYSYVNIWINNRSIKHLQGFQTRLKTEDVVTIFLPSAGG